MEIRNYKQAINYLEGFIGKIVFKVNKEFVKKHDPLERMRILLSFLGNPQDKFKSILVGGTSGKGSTSYLISHILTAAGYKTGLTLSPHLQKVNERLQINGKEISDKKFTKMVSSMIQIIEKMKNPPAGGGVGAPSYFEILVGMAFTYFVKEKVDIAVVEVGMGGEFDATNTLNPLIAVLTNVGLDHTNVLGKTVEKIAKTKAGIIKKIKDERLKIKESKENHKSLIINHKSPIVVSGVKQPAVIKVVEDRSKKVGAKLFRLGEHFGFKIKNESENGITFDFYGCHPEFISGSKIPKRVRDYMFREIKLSLLGRYQAENASLAIKTALELRKFGFKVSDKNIKKALSTAFFPGRFEILPCHPELFSGSKHDRKNKMLKQVQHDNEKTIILDGAHNPTKMKEFLKSLEKIFSKEGKIFIIGFKFDKDIKKMLSQIVKVADEIIVTEFKAKTDVAVHASAEALRIKDELLRMNYRGKITVEKDSKKALEKALDIPITQHPNNPSVIVVTGSLYLVGEVRGLLRK